MSEGEVEGTRRMGRFISSDCLGHESTYNFVCPWWVPEMSNSIAEALVCGERMVVTLTQILLARRSNKLPSACSLWCSGGNRSHTVQKHVAER